MKKNDLSVVFLMWVPYGIGFLYRFIESYQKHYAGAEHDLIILYNGYGTSENLEPFKIYLKEQNINHFQFNLESGQDIKAYRWVAERVETPYILFFNTYSQILHNDWAKNYLNAIQGDNVGCVGATGSWQSWASVGFQKAKLFFHPTSAIKRKLPYFHSKQVHIGSITIEIHPRLVLLGSLIKSLKVTAYFPKFPNPHLRTNAFVIARNTWLGLNIPDLKSKNEAHWFESGNESLTRQLLKLGKRVLVMNKYGELFEPVDWHRSKTLWSAHQEDLLVSDNFTGQYNSGPNSNNIAFENFLWGSNQ